MNSDIVAAVSALFSFISLLLVVLQLRQNTEQRRLESVLSIYDVNRHLIALGFENPELFKVLQDGTDIDPTMERRYLQLWLNQIAIIHFLESRGLIAPELGEGFNADIAGFLAMENMQRHWQRHKRLYPASLRAALDALIPTASPDSNNKPHPDDEAC